MRLKVIIPNSGMDRDTLLQREKMLSAFAMPSTEISVECIAHGPESIESAYDEILAGPYVIQQAVEAEKAGFDAVIVYCGSDPAVAAAREILNIPVIGEGLKVGRHGHQLSLLCADRFGQLRCSRYGSCMGEGAASGQTGICA